MKNFRELAGQMAPQDVFIFYLAGHGEVRNGRYLFLPADLVFENEQALTDGAIGQADLERLLVGVPANKSLVLLDTCHSGIWAQQKPWGRGLEQKTAIECLMKATGRAIIAASGQEQMALEGYRGHGVFTYAVLEGLRGAADLGGNRNRQIELEELALHVREVVPRLTREQWNYEQFPMINLQGMDFPLGLLDE